MSRRRHSRRRGSRRQSRRCHSPCFRGPRIVRVAGDGNCLFRALAHAVHLDHATVRSALTEHVAAHWSSRYEQFVPECDRASYLCRMRRHGTWGDELMLAAFAAVFCRTVVVHRSDSFAEVARYGDARAVTRVLFDGSHYDVLAT